MRIVNIVLGVVLGLLLLVPLFAMGLSPTAIGYMMGRVMAAVLMTIVFGLVAWFASGRDERAREAGFTIGLVLAIVSAFSPLAERNSSAKTQRAPAQNAQGRAGQVQDALQDHPYAGADPDSEEGRAFAVLKESFEDLLRHTARLEQAMEHALSYDLRAVALTGSRQRLIEARDAAARYREAARDQREYISGFNSGLKAKLTARGVDGKIRDNAIRSLGADNDEERPAVQRMRLHETLAGHVERLVGILNDDWGKWTYDQSSNTFLFEDAQTKDSINTMMRLIQEGEQALRNTNKNKKTG